MVPDLSCPRSGSRSRGSTLVLVPVWAEVGVSLFPCQGQAGLQPNLPRGDLYSASSPWVPLPPADGVGFTLCDGVWLPQEGDSWQNLGSCSAGGRGGGMRADRDTGHEKINRTPSDEECFFDLLSKFQSNRMDDQRCPLEECPAEAAEAAATRVPALGERISQSTLMASPQTEEFFDLIASSQSRRLDDQRANVGNLPGLRITHNNLGHLRVEGDAQEPGDEFFNMLMKCQSSRIDDQRCAPPDSIPRGPTMPDEDFFSLIQRVQAKRMDEQRVDLASAQEEEEEQQRPGSS
ncbi:G-protein-signaling modulator 1 isoform X2 [Prinia subflava]|uniref:G-protein-signaling modulator 1 isoform X2 n=1 Tax=Prinia subflava TaxID=208062 RepID=UPI002FE00022